MRAAVWHVRCSSDSELAAEVKATAPAADESRLLVRKAIDKRYTLPA